MPPARSDARRNRAAVLAAVERLVREGGVDRLRVADVAREAGVGPGTIYRAFGSKSALVLALLDDRERELQDAVLRGPPPLGPGAPAARRLRAFIAALHDLTLREREVLLAADAGSALARHRTGAHKAWRLHLAVLLRELRPEADADVFAELLLAPLSAALYVHAVEDLAVPPERLRREVLRLADLIAAGPAEPRRTEA